MHRLNSKNNIYNSVYDFVFSKLNKNKEKFKHENKLYE